MSADHDPQTAPKVGPRSNKRDNRLLYVGVCIYSLIHMAWIAWVFFGDPFFIFDTAGGVGFLLPIIGLATLIMLQRPLTGIRFSTVANVFAVIAIIGWFFIVWNLVTVASAAV